MSNALQEFLNAAKGQGASDESLVALLRGRGWPEDDVYRALANHYETHSGVRVPEYKRSGSAKERVSLPAELFHAGDVDDRAGIGDVHIDRPLDKGSA